MTPIPDRYLRVHIPTFASDDATFDAGSDAEGWVHLEGVCATDIQLRPQQEVRAVLHVIPRVLDELQIPFTQVTFTPQNEVQVLRDRLADATERLAIAQRRLTEYSRQIHAMEERTGDCHCHDNPPRSGLAAVGVVLTAEQQQRIRTLMGPEGDVPVTDTIL